MPLISVIMGVYNCENQKELLYKSIDSILNQTLTDFEFIICDDGSTDKSFEILKEIMKKDKRTKVIKNAQNSGLAYTLNHCLSNAKGEFIARQDADDFSDSTRFERQIDFLQKNNQYDFVSANCYLYDGKKVTKILKKEEFPTRKDLVKDVSFVHPATVFKKETLEKAQGYRAVKETRRCEDYDLYMRLYALGSMGANLQTPLLYYYSNENEYYRRRKIIYYLELTSVLFKGNLAMGTLLPKGIFYSIKPVVSAIIPSKVMWYLRKKLVIK